LTLYAAQDSIRGAPWAQTILRTVSMATAALLMALFTVAVSGHSTPAQRYWLGCDAKRVILVIGCTAAVGDRRAGSQMEGSSPDTGAGS